MRKLLLGIVLLTGFCGGWYSPARLCSPSLNSQSIIYYRDSDQLHWLGDVSCVPATAQANACQFCGLLDLYRNDGGTWTHVMHAQWYPDPDCGDRPTVNDWSNVKARFGSGQYYAYWNGYYSCNEFHTMWSNSMIFWTNL